MNKVYVLAFFLSLLSCAQTAHSGKQNAPITQGIQGKIEVREGDFMPGPNRGNQPIPPSKSSIAVREIFIYEPTKLSQVTNTNGFYTAIQTKLVKKVNSDKDGLFQVALNPGKYSVFSKEPNGFFSNRFDGEGYIFLVEVKPKQITPVSCVIDYNASY